LHRKKSEREREIFRISPLSEEKRGKKISPRKQGLANREEREKRGEEKGKERKGEQVLFLFRNYRYSL